jgi:hypothetical protein
VSVRFQIAVGMGIATLALALLALLLEWTASGARR